jgi:hypothetical protein
VDTYIGKIIVEPAKVHTKERKNTDIEIDEIKENRNLICRIIHRTI